MNRRRMLACCFAVGTGGDFRGDRGQCLAQLEPHSSTRRAILTPAARGWSSRRRTSRHGGRSMELDLNHHFNPATGFVGPAGFETQTSALSRSHRHCGWRQSEPPRTLDVGVVGGPFPTTYVDPSNLAIYSGQPNLGSFTRRRATKRPARSIAGRCANLVRSDLATRLTANVYTAPSGSSTVVGRQHANDGEVQRRPSRRRAAHARAAGVVAVLATMRRRVR